MGLKLWVEDKDMRNVRRILTAVCIVISAPSWAEGYKWQEEMKGSFQKGFFLTCIPTFESQLDRAGMLDRVSLEQRISYCTCVGIGIFDDFTLKEINEFSRTGDLPARKQRIRQQFSNRCADKISLN